MLIKALLSWLIARLSVKTDIRQIERQIAVAEMNIARIEREIGALEMEIETEEVQCQFQ